ncbi:MAG: CRTAC1 family protein [Polyangiales bacterium]
MGSFGRGRWRCRRLWTFVLWAMLAACSGEQALFVDVRTDFIPGLDFDEIEVQLDNGSVAPIRADASSSGDYVMGLRIGSFADLAPGTHGLTAQLRRGSTLVIERSVSITYDSDQAVATIVITRSCLGVTCDTEGAPSCLGGSCVDERCTEETPEFCPPAMCECTPSACEDAICAAGGACLYRSLCPAGEACRAGICTSDTLPSAVCPTGSWSPGTPVFRDATTEWGLDAFSGTRVHIVDLNNDGWPDVVAHNVATMPEDFAAGGARSLYVLENDGSSFRDLTQESGIVQSRGGSSSLGRAIAVTAFADVNNDGYPDAYTGCVTEPGVGLSEQRSEIMLGNADGSFSLGPEGAISNTVDSPSGASFVDFDRDGNLDLLVGQYYFDAGAGRVAQNDRLYRGDGAGGFTDVTSASGLTTQPWGNLDDVDQGLAHSIAWGTLARDVDSDGWPDLLVSSYGRAPNHFWRNVNGVFENQSVVSGYAFDPRMDWRDNWGAQCYCLANGGRPECAGVASPPPGLSRCPPWDPVRSVLPSALGGFSGTTAAGDLDGDGDLDLLTSEIWNVYTGSSGDKSEILFNEGAGRFVRPGPEVTGAVATPTAMYQEQTHLSNAVLDFDNDGRLDVLLCAAKSDEPSALLRQTGARAFAEVNNADASLIAGMSSAGVADFDRDGDLDVLVAGPSGRSLHFLENVTPPASFVEIQLQPTEGSNEWAVGAQVTVQTATGTQLQEVGGGHGHYGGQDDRVLHFGLGGACEAQVMVRWPDETQTTATYTLPAGHRFAVSATGVVVAPAP